MTTEHGHEHEYPGSPVRPGSGRRRVPQVLAAPFAARTWGEFAHLLLNLPIATATFVYAVTALALGTGLLVTFIGVPVLALGLAGCRGVGVLERARARALLGLRVAEPQPVRRRKPGVLGWMTSVLRSGESWRQLLYTLLHFPWAVFAFCLVLPVWAYGWAMLTYPLWQWVFPRYADIPGIQLYGDGDRQVYLDSPPEIALASVVGLALTLLVPWLIRGLASVDRLMVAELLGPSRLENRVVELESDRGAVVDTAAADLRRIERELRDGAQARLQGLEAELGLAKAELEKDPQSAARLVAAAHGEVKAVLQELRGLARGIHPAILTDRGLDPALSALAARCPVPVRVEVDLPARPAPAVEGIAYFAVSELLQNVSRHSQARSARVDVWRSGHRLMLQVSDDGLGGAAPQAGTGLTALARRMDAVDGVLVVDSPAGSGTTATAEIPWRPS
ncbi:MULTISPECIES: sensor histidine kinase [Streptomyces diastaticus group]|uniref:histidine kinase n=1 Tax=Streptomyces gougerotii TaxID=53448 RepID=A0A8H9LHX6_9ACTN|nr:sensor histidine kinase [Streptomyces gougerotii]WSU37374.1 sensor domain-containing protein [Streptomyces gougerotii]GFH80691.1 histidine kinase [Streptomyces gougerotii]GGU62393.1 histidine kinase [Streptomyces gougerotii]